MAEGRIHWISGPVLRARSSDSFHVQDAIAVGPSALLGEIVRLGTDEIVAQVYEDTTGLKPGDLITGTGEPLSVKLGPSLLGQIFDGLLRPLSGAGDFVRPGAGESLERALRLRARRACRRCSARRAVDRRRRDTDDASNVWLLRSAEGSLCRSPPPASTPRMNPFARLRGADGSAIELSLAQRWPVRQPRPSQRRLPLAGPMITGTRILDTLVPDCARRPSRNTRQLRHRQDCVATITRQMERCRHHRVRGVR